jgi:hypothetical protein
MESFIDLWYVLVGCGMIQQYASFNYRVRRSLLLVPVMRQMNPARTFVSHFIKIHFIIILISVISSQVFFFFKVFRLKFCMHPHLSYACHMPRPSHPPWFDYPSNTCWRMQIMKKLIMQFPPASCLFLLLGPNIHFRTFLWITFYILPLRWETSFTPMQNNK